MPRWKSGKDAQHIGKRIRRKQASELPTLEAYNRKIIEIVSTEENQLYLYFLQGFQQNYFVIGDGVWIVIVGEDGIMETSFPPDQYVKYLSKDGYTYLGTIAEVRR